MSSRKERRKAKRRTDKLREEAWAAVEKGRLPEARRWIERAVEKGPGNARTWNDRGRILELCGDELGAERSLRRAVELSPSYVEPLTHLVRLLTSAGALEEACRFQSRVVAAEPGSQDEERRLEGLLAQLDAGAEPAQRRALAAAQAPDPTRTAAFDWDAVGERLERRGCALLPGLLTRGECASLVALDGEVERFEHAVPLGERGSGSGLYRFFRRPLPELVQALREELYWRAAPIANRWSGWLGRGEPYPALLDGFLAVCRGAGQRRTTPLLFRYERGSSNDLHRDLHGEVFFPLQLAVTLGPATAADGQGGEFVLADVRPGRRTKASELAPGAGDGVLFCTRERLVRVGGVHGLQPVMHGVRRLEGERRFVLGVPFHDYA